MQNNERWQELCEQASKDQDLEKLLRFMAEDNRLLEEKNLSPRTVPGDRSVK
jgi:hypothetical protein